MWPGSFLNNRTHFRSGGTNSGTRPVAVEKHPIYQFQPLRHSEKFLIADSVLGLGHSVIALQQIGAHLERQSFMGIEIRHCVLKPINFFQQCSHCSCGLRWVVQALAAPFQFGVAEGYDYALYT